MAAYPATLLTTDASPSRLLTSIDPLLPLGVLTKCLNAYTGTMCVPSISSATGSRPVEQKTQPEGFKPDDVGGQRDENH